MGLTAVQLLLDMIDGRQVDPERLIPLNLSPGFTLAPPA
jgi:DNA-binding LacI/PurR family transcriptional regulator